MSKRVYLPPRLALVWHLGEIQYLTNTQRVYIPPRVNITWNYPRQGGSSTCIAQLKVSHKLESHIFGLSSAIVYEWWTVLHRLQSSITPTLTQSAALNLRHRLASSISIRSSTTGDIKVQHRLATNTAGILSQTANLPVIHRLASSITCLSTTTNAFNLRKALASSIATVSTTTGSLTVAHKLASSINCISTATNAINVTHLLASSISASLSQSCGISVLHRLSSSINVALVTTADLRNIVGLGGNVTCLTTTIANLKVQHTLETVISVVSAVTGELSSVILLTSIIGSIVSTNTALAVHYALNGLANTVLANTALLSLLLDLIGSADFQSNTNADLTVNFALASSISITSTTTTELVVSIYLQSNIDCTTTTTANLYLTLQIEISNVLINSSTIADLAISIDLRTETNQVTTVNADLVVNRWLDSVINSVSTQSAAISFAKFLESTLLCRSECSADLSFWELWGIPLPSMEQFNNFWIDVEDINGNKLGDGPLAIAKVWKSIFRLNKAGEFSFSIPLSYFRADLITPLLVVKCYTTINDVITLIGDGIISNIEKASSLEGTEIAVSGNDLLGELSKRSVGFLAVDEPSDGKIGLVAIKTFFPTDWDYETYDTTEGDIYATFAGESCLNALTKVSEKLGENFRYNPTRKVKWLRKTTPSSGIRATNLYVDPIAVESNTNLCLITDLQETQDSYELYTRVYPYGAGNGNDRLDLWWSDLTLPVGWTIDKTYNYIQNDAAVATYGLIERFVSYKDIAPISNSDLDLLNASNYLLYAAYEELKRAIEPQYSYSIKVDKLDKLVYPGETIDIEYYEYVDNVLIFSVVNTLTILESTFEINAYGVRTTNLTVSTSDKWPKNDFDVIAGQMQDGKVMEAHPQMNVCYFSESFGERSIDASNGVTFTFKFGNEVTKLNRCLLRFSTDVFETTAKGVASGGSIAQSTTGGGGVQKTSGPTNPATDVSSELAHSHFIEIIRASSVGSMKTIYTSPGANGGMYYVDSSGDSLWGGTDYSSDASLPPIEHSHDINHSHDISIDEHSHDVSIDPHSHDLEYGIYRQTGVYPGPVSVFINSEDKTSELGGPWGDDSPPTATGDVEVDITDYVNIRNSINSVAFSVTGGEGRIQANIRAFVTVQAILLS